MRFNITMKFSFTNIIFIYWSMLSTANDIQISLEFPNYVNEFRHLCKNEMISINFANAAITSIGRDFISSPLITCLNFTNIHIENIEKGAFNKLPNLTQLIFSNTNVKKLFNFGDQENLKILILNNATTYDYYEPFMIVDIAEEYPNLEILSFRRNHIYDLLTSTEKTPFPKLKILDLSSNNIKNTNFVKLLPNSLHFLDLHDNSLNSLDFDKKQINLLALNLDNNNLKYVKKYQDLHDHSSNPYEYNSRHYQMTYDYKYKYDNDRYDQHNSYNFGLVMHGLANLHYLSISGNKIDFIDSNPFENINKLVYLNLSRNNIGYLYPETFEKLQSLRSLDLSFNKFEDVPQFLNETIINFLSLNCNNIKNVTVSNAFVQMPKLTKLLLAGNQIDEINVKIFAHLSLLEILDLSRNKLSFLPELSESLTSLKYLNLNDNKFTSLESLSLTSALPLMEIDLAMNPLEYLEVSYFKNLPQNLTVNLIQKSNFAHWNSDRCGPKE